MARKALTAVGGAGGSLANKLIAYAFSIGVVVALVLGLISSVLPAGAVSVLTTLLILAGIVVGFFNIQRSEQKDYVLFVTALVIVTSLSKGSLAGVQVVGGLLESVLGAILAFILPSVIIVAIRAVLNLART